MTVVAWLLLAGAGISLLPPIPRSRAPATVAHRARAPACEEGGASVRTALAFRVRDALIAEEEKQFTVWSEANPRPLSINLDLLTYRARTRIKRGDFKAAKATYLRCTEIDPEDGRAWLGLSRMSARRGRREKAEQYLLQGLTYAPNNEYLLQAHGSLLEKYGGRDDDALALYSRALRANPRHAPAWVACGLLLQRRRKLAAAERCLLLAKAVAPLSYYVWQVVGQWYERQGDLSRARAAFRESLRLNPTNAASFHAWGVLEWRCGHNELARELFKRGLAQQPRNKYLLQSWACMEARSGASAAAHELFERAAAEGGLDGALWQARGMQNAAEGRLGQARLCFANGVAREPRHTPLYHAWGVLEVEQGNATAAREIFQRGIWAATPNHPTSVGLWTAWALLEERAGDPARARDHLRSALRCDRFSITARAVWATVEARQGDMAAARQLYEDALRIDPKNAEVWLAYEEAERAAKRPAAAAAVFERAEAALAAEVPGSPGSAAAMARATGAASSPDAAQPAGGAGPAGGALPSGLSVAPLPTPMLTAAAEAAAQSVAEAQKPRGARTLRDEYGTVSGQTRRLEGRSPSELEQLGER